MEKIKVLIIDDSALFRSILSRELAKVPEIEVAGTAPDPFIGREKIIRLEPDVVILDVEMPGMDGLTFLKKLMLHKPIPVIMLSAQTAPGCELGLKALEAGAIEVMQKPTLDEEHKLWEMLTVLTEKIKAAKAAKRNYSRPKEIKSVVSELRSGCKYRGVVVAIGASTGGTEALNYLIPRLPEDFPCIMIAQHMPEYFTKAFANQLASKSKMEVREAESGIRLKPGLVIIAKGNYHLLLRRCPDGYCTEVKSGPLVCRQRPSVEVLFSSVAKYAGKEAIGVILTGMGDDGADGLLRMKEAGAITIGQDEDSCVVYGMPKEAYARGALDKVLPLEQIPSELVRAAAYR